MPGQPDAQQRGASRRWAKRGLVGASAIAALALVFYGAGGWYLSGKLYHEGLSAKAKRAAHVSYNLRIEAVTPGSLTLALHPGSPRKATLAGVWGLEWPGGYGQTTRLVSQTATSAVWDYRMITGNPPRAGGHLAMNVTVFPLNPKVGLGLNYSNLYYRGPLGNYPAWLVPASSHTWAITVHGDGLTRLDCIKIVPALHDLGLPVLMITYRNDPGAPSSPHGILRYGTTEWEDLQASARYALAHGAKHLVLVGYSMGGSIVTSFLLHSPLARDVTAVVLDSPMLDFSATVDYGATFARLPGGLPIPASLVSTAKWIAGIRYGIDWRRLDYLRQAKRLHVPILLFQGLADHTVPPATSQAFANAGGKRVTYITVADAGHLESWNLDPAPYDLELTDFLRHHLSRG